MKKAMLIAAAAVTMTLGGCSCMRETVVVMVDPEFQWDGAIHIKKQQELFCGLRIREILLKSKDGRTIEIDASGLDTLVTRTGRAKPKRRTPTTRPADAATMDNRPSGKRVPRGTKYTTIAGD